ncbi:MAG: DNRLRE domain-containing protein, partial [Planctomycetales bacterium]|nr:DNRLRE domain-containing protein [Planctomycetales bacterium]
VYVTGNSSATWGSPVQAISGGTDAVAAKLDSSGSLLWNTFLGGSGTDNGRRIAVDSSGNVYVAGSSTATWGSPDQPYSSGTDGFAAELDSSGNRLWHSFVGGSGTDVANAIAVDGSGHVYVAGNSTATWGTPLQGYSSGQDAYVAKITVAGVAIDAASSGTAVNATGVTFSHTVSGTNRLLLVSVATEPTASEGVSSVTYNGTSLSFVGSRLHAALNVRIETWALVAPATGTHNVVITLSAQSKAIAAGAVSFTGVDQSTPLGAYASAEGDSSTATVNVASANGELVYGFAGVRKGTDATPGAGQTEQTDVKTGNIEGVGSTEAGAASVVTSWSLDVSDKWIASGVSIKPFGTVTIEVSPVQDTYIQGKNPTTNTGTQGSLVIDRESGDLQRALLQFDLSSIPAGSTITSATLKLNATAIDGSLTIQAYQLQQSWAEGSATWNQRTSGTNWTSAGSTYNTTPLDSITTNLTGLHAFNLTTLAQAWLAGTQQNYGVMLGSMDGGGNRTATYDSREGGTPPVLEITYTPPPNSDPTISVPGGAVNYIENDPATLIDATATAIDSDSGNLDAGTLTIEFTANGTLNDRLAIRNQGTGAGQIGVSGSNVTYAGVNIGTFTGGTDGSTPLVITFNASSTPAAAQ